MSTTPLTPKENLPYTVIGSPHGGQNTGFLITVLILADGSQHDVYEALKRVSALAIREMIVVDSSSRNRDSESLCREFPNLRLMIVDSLLSTGQKINLAMREARENMVFVVKSSQRLLPFLESSMQELIERRSLCTVPLHKSPSGDLLPIVHVPLEHKNQLTIVNHLPSRDILPSLYPYDYVGLYDREKFLSMGGYDTSYHNPYWQKVEFGYRCRMWGETIVCQAGIRLQNSYEIEAENTSADADYLRFFLHVLLLEYENDHAVLASRRFWNYWKIASGSYFKRKSQFKAAQAWVQAHAYLYKHDARYITELWTKVGES